MIGMVLAAGAGRRRSPETIGSYGRAERERGAFEEEIVRYLFHLRPEGTHKVLVCHNISCWMNGADELTDLIKSEWTAFVKEAASDERGDFYASQELFARRRFVDCDVLSRIVEVNRPGRRNAR